MKAQNLAVIGAGNMGSSLVKGLIQHGWPVENVWVSDPSQVKQTALLTQFPDIHVSANNKEVVSAADIIVFAVKPSVVQTVCEECRDNIVNHKKLILSIAAGVSTKLLQKWLSDESALVRAMPNIAATLGASATGLYANAVVNAEEKTIAETVMRTLGLIVWCQQESDLNIITALSGSGPAYFFYVMEILEKAAINLGLSEESARLLTRQTAFGAAKLALSLEIDVKTLRSEVTSPGGTTEAALKILTQGQFHDILQKAVNSACEKSEIIGNTLLQENQ